MGQKTGQYKRDSQESRDWRQDQDLMQVSTSVLFQMGPGEGRPAVHRSGAGLSLFPEHHHQKRKSKPLLRTATLPRSTGSIYAVQSLGTKRLRYCIKQAPGSPNKFMRSSGRRAVFSENGFPSTGSEPLLLTAYVSLPP